MHHSFDTSIAEEYNVNIAIFLNNMAYWIKHNMANEKHFHDGRYWTYNSVKSYSSLFPYWTPKQVRTIIEQCVEQGLIVKGNYNEKKYDQTQWYGLTDLALKLLNLLSCPKRQMELPEKANALAQNGKPIPDINTDINTDIKQERGRKRPSARTHIDSSFIPSEKHVSLSDRLEVNLKEETEKFIDYYRSRGSLMSDWNACFNNWLRKASSFKKKEHSVTQSIGNIKKKSEDFRQFLL